MKRILVSTVLFMLCITKPVIAVTDDSIPLSEPMKRNNIVLEFFGHTYLSPFGTPTKFIPLSINYSRTIDDGNSYLQLSVGVSTIRSFYYESSGNQYLSPRVIHRPWGICLPLGVLWRLHYKRNGLWGGLCITQAFVKQQYLEARGNVNPTIIHTFNYDYQLMPEICYQFHSRDESIVCKISYTPKISSVNFGDYEDGSMWSFLPFWGGISIGGGW